MIPARIEPTGRGTTVFAAFAGDELLAVVTAGPGDDEDTVIDELWAAIEGDVAAGQVLLGVYDGATGWPLPVGDRRVAAN